MVRQSSNTDVFQAIACPTRRTILRLLAERERRVGELADELNIRQPSVSEQLRVLRETHLVAMRREGRERIYRVNEPGFRPLIDWISDFSRFWDEKIDRLGAFLESKQTDKQL